LATFGRAVSTTTISDWFLYANPYRGSIRKSNKVPFAKFASKNIQKFQKYEQIVGGIYPRKIKFCDEKSLKGLELIGTSVRIDPLTGHVPPALMPRDFKVRYSIIGICGMDVTVPPMFYHISDGNTTGTSFVEFIKCAVSMNYLKKMMSWCWTMRHGIPVTTAIFLTIFFGIVKVQMENLFTFFLFFCRPTPQSYLLLSRRGIPC
jgi:hypothetical protein